MPCSDGMSFSSQRISELASRNDKLARIACDLAKHSRIDIATNPMLSQETKQWWGQHQKEDAARALRKAEHQAAITAKRAALAKLTYEDRQILGLK